MKRGRDNGGWSVNETMLERDQISGKEKNSMFAFM
jgi:hypothetical protein